VSDNSGAAFVSYLRGGNVGPRRIPSVLPGDDVLVVPKHPSECGRDDVFLGAAEEFGILTELFV
jgi:hypothetical protein